MSIDSPDRIVINGRAVDVSGAPVHQSVLGFLRENGWTGCKEGCNEGDCGACTILVKNGDGPPRAINGCLALTASLAGREIVTAEGVARDGELHPVQRAMVECNGSQCGYCTPGFVCSMVEAHHRDLRDPAAIADQLNGNLCRCTGYRPIREAMLQAVKETLPPLVEAETPPPEPSAEFHAADGMWLRPRTVAEALDLKETRPGAVFIAGATEIAVRIHKLHERHPAFIALEGIAELREISATSDAWSIGAGAALTDIETALAGEFPALDRLFRLFASRQIRHRATLGGNLATASPIGDSAPVLLALDARVILASPAGRRTLPLAEFFTGYRKTAMRPDELIVSVLIPRRLPGRTAFYKVSKRREMDIATVSAAFRVATDDHGIVTEARLAFGGVAATPTRALATERALIGKPLAATSELLDLLESGFTPLDDFRGSAAYRRRLIRGLWETFVNGGECDALPSFEESTFPSHSDKGMPHESAVGHVTGAAMYCHDIALRRGALAVWLVRSPHAHAEILRLDVSRVAGAPGVRAVLTAADVPGLNNTGPARHDEPLFAMDRVEFHGQVISAVVGDSLEQCRLAAGMVEVEYHALPPLLGIEAAIAAGSFHTDPHFLTRGDVETALAESPQILEGEIHIGGQEHFYLETQAAWAEPADGGVHVCSSTQHPSEVQTIVAEILGVARHQVVVESPRMGGGFGGKETQGNAWAAICALAALKTGRMVAIQLDRDHDMESTGKRHPFFAKYRVGHDADGLLQAADIRLFSDGGWSLDLSQPVNDRGLFHLDNAYFIPHVRFRGQVAKTNVTSHTAFRGFGGPQGMLVIEEILGRIAGRLGLPPEQVRQRNFYHGTGETNTTHYGEEIDDNRLQRIWDELLASSDFATRRGAIDAWNLAHPHRKRGIAITPVKFGISFTLKHYNQAGALVLMYADGSVQVNHGGTEMGQGLHTKILGVAMRELGLPASSIRLMHTRTDKVPNTSATAASSGSDLNGMAVADACRQLRERLAALAGTHFGCPAADIRFSDAHASAPHGSSLSIRELATMAYVSRVQLSAAGFYATPDLQWDWAVGKGRPFHYFAFGAAVSEVEIDQRTGVSCLRRVDILHDVGDSLNPEIDRGQIEGGFVQGAGWLTTEELKWNADGRLLTHSASTYAIPAFSDVPPDFRVSLLSRAAQAGTIHGSKAVGEPPLMLALSVREAIRHALQAAGTPPDAELHSPCSGESVRALI